MLTWLAGVPESQGDQRKLFPEKKGGARSLGTKDDVNYVAILSGTS